VAGLEATSTESVEGTLVLEVFGEVDENENLSDTRVHEEDRRLVSCQLEGNDGVVLLSLAVLGEQGVDIVGEAGDNGVLQDLDGGDFRQVEMCFSLALEPDDVLVRVN
jgi:hypothetical protein